MISALIVFFGLFFLIIIHELGHFWAAKYFGVWVEEFGFGFPPRILKKKIGETIYSFNWLPFGGFVKLRGEMDLPADANGEFDSRSFFCQKPWKKVIVIIAGVVMNFLVGWIIVSAVFWIGMPPLIFIDSVSKNSSAELAGLRAGDLINDWQEVAELVKFINDNRGNEVVLNINRDGNNLDIKVTPRTEVPVGEGALGIALHGGGLPRQGFFSGLYNGWIMSWKIAVSVVLGIYQLFLSPQNVVGPVGIFNIAVNTGKVGLIYVLQLLGLISINLAVLNILPIPVLDGGRLLFIVIEKLRGKPFSKKIEIRANAISFIFLIILIILVTFKDINALL